MESTRLRAADAQLVSAAAALLCAVAWAAGRLHPWPLGALPGAALTTAATWLAVTDTTSDTDVAIGVSIGAGAAYALASCLVHNLIGLVLVGAVVFQWATGQWLVGLAGAATGLAVAAYIVKRGGNVDYWLEFVWVTLVSSLFGPGLAVYALIQLRWPARLDAWLLLVASPWILIRARWLRGEPL